MEINLHRLTIVIFDPNFIKSMKFFNKYSLRLDLSKYTGCYWVKWGVLRLQNSNELFENDLLTNLFVNHFQKVHLNFEGVKPPI